MSLWNHDDAWFDVSYEKGAAGNILSEDVMSLTVNEEMGKMTTGSLRLRDPNMQYARDLCLYTKLDVVWGKQDLRYSAITGKEGGRKVRFMVNDPTGEGDDRGLVTYNCNLVLGGALGDYRNVPYDRKSRKEIVDAVMDNMGVDSRIVSFPTMGSNFTDGQGCMQAANDFHFLTVRAAEWGAYFTLGYDLKGKLWGFFVDASNLSRVAKTMSGVSNTHFIYGAMNMKDYVKSLTLESPIVPGMKNASNVISYKWQRNTSNALRGDGVNVQVLNGETVVQRWDVQQEKVVTWRFEPSLVNDEHKRQIEAGNELRFVISTLKRTDWEYFKQFFTQIEGTTAPQGNGYRVSVKMMGDPTVSVGAVATFGRGFAECIGAPDRIWWIQKAVHSFGMDGYFTDVELIDNYAFSPDGNVNTALTLLGAAG